MSTIRQLIENSLKVRDRERVLGTRVVPVAFSPQYGTEWKDKDGRRDQRANATMNSRAFVLCGGCNWGQVPVRDVKGAPTGETRPHRDCEGMGVRVNRRYGRCGKGRLRG